MTDSHPTLKQLMPTEKGMNISISNTTIENVSNLLAEFFMAKGFVLGSGTITSGVYETGSAGSRVVIGGFAKRQKYSVSILGDASIVNAMVQSEMSGASGSVLGVVRERKGRDEIKSALQFFLQSRLSN